MQQRINQAQDIFLFYINSLGRGFATKSLHQKVQLTRNFIETIHPIKDHLKQDFLIQKAAKNI